MLRSERGVTLVEMVLALAIAGLLAATILFGRDSLRNRQEFSQGVDEMVNTIADARNQATATVGQNGSNPGAGTGAGADEVTYGKLMKIDTTGKATISTEVINDSTFIVKQVTDSYSVQIPWGVAPTTTQYLLFALQHGGAVATFCSTTAGPGMGSFKSGTMTLGPCPAFVVSHGGQTAHITVDQYGNVSRVYP